MNENTVRSALYHPSPTAKLLQRDPVAHATWLAYVDELRDRVMAKYRRRHLQSYDRIIPFQPRTTKQTRGEAM